MMCAASVEGHFDKVWCPELVNIGARGREGGGREGEGGGGMEGGGR